MRYLAMSLLACGLLATAAAVRHGSAPETATRVAAPAKSDPAHAAAASIAPTLAAATQGRSKAAPEVEPHAPRLPRHEALAERARAGDAGAALELAGLLESCEERGETRGMLAILKQDWGPPSQCRDDADCDAEEEAFDAMQESVARSRADGQACERIPRDWIDRRGRWLERAAELGDVEARACYALVGVELAPQAYDASFALWMEQWRRQALPWAWAAWREGEPRAALALARLYAPAAAFGGDTRLVEPDPARAYRFALLLARGLELDQGASDLAQLAAQGDALLGPRELAEAEVWVQSQLPRLSARAYAPSRTPNRCWQHFAVFEARDGAEYAAAR